jgi:quercetin dioxygenase-like cupin family protein
MFFHTAIPARLWKKRERVSAYSISGKAAQLTYVRLEPGEAAHHRHPSEQMGIVLTGSLEISIGAERRVCGPGDGYCIPGDTPRGFEVRGDAPVEYIEVFAPPKSENTCL